jgi:hypothetical protein
MKKYKVKDIHGACAGFSFRASHAAAAVDRMQIM